MRTFTYLQASTKVLKDLDLFEESPIAEDELVSYFNDAIDAAAAEINRLGRENDYFLTNAFIDLVNGVSEYELPDDIYVRDIRRIMYQNGSQIYPVRRFRGANKFESIAMAQQFNTSGDYKYYEEMGSDESQGKLVLIPPSRETDSAVMKIHYIREPRYIPLIADGSEDETNATVLDIPQFIRFIFAHVKVSILDKMKEPVDSAMLQLQIQRQYLVDTLSGFQDDDDSIIPDMSHYAEST